MAAILKVAAILDFHLGESDIVTTNSIGNMCDSFKHVHTFVMSTTQTGAISGHHLEKWPPSWNTTGLIKIVTPIFWSDI